MPFAKFFGYANRSNITDFGRAASSENERTQSNARGLPTKTNKRTTSRKPNITVRRLFLLILQPFLFAGPSWTRVERVVTAAKRWGRGSASELANLSFARRVPHICTNSHRSAKFGLVVFFLTRACTRMRWMVKTNWKKRKRENLRNCPSACIFDHSSGVLRSVGMAPVVVLSFSCHTRWLRNRAGGEWQKSRTRRNREKEKRNKIWNQIKFRRKSIRDESEPNERVAIIGGNSSSI